MKKIVSAVLILVFVLQTGYFGSMVSAKGTFIEDAGFENMGSKGTSSIGETSVPWSVWKPSTSKNASASIQAGDSYAGEFSCYSEYGAVIKQNLSGLQPNSDYVVSAWVKTGVSSATFMVREGSNIKHIIINDEENENTYKKYSVQFKTGDFVSVTELLFFTEADGQAYIDDVTVEVDTGEEENGMAQADITVERLRALGALNESLFSDRDYSKIITYKAFYDMILPVIYIEPDYVKNYNPDEKMTIEKAAATFITLLGYNYMVEARGGTGVAYVSAAAENKLTVGMSGRYENGLSIADAVIMYSNTLEAAMLRQVGFGDNVSFEVQKGRTLLTEKLKVYNNTGIITDNGKTKINGKSSVDSTFVMIDDMSLDRGKTHAQELLGYKVKYYYIEDDGAYTLKYIEKHRSDSIKISADKISDETSNDDFVYEEINSKIKIDIAATANVIYNGKFLDKAYAVEDSLFKPKAGSVTLIDSDDDGNYDLVIISDLKYYVVDFVRLSEETIYFKNADFIKVEGSNVRITKEGATKSVEDIKEWDVISVMQSQDTDYLELVISNALLNGTISEVNSMDNEITIGNLQYELSAYAINAIGDYKIGKSSAFLLDFSGRIIGYKDADTFANVGYLIKTAKKGLGKLQFKIFASDGTMKIITGASKYTLNGETGKKEQDLINLIGTTSQLIGYELNSAGELSALKTTQMPTDFTDGKMYFTDDDEENLVKNYTGTNITYKQNLGGFVDSFLINSQTLMFAIPGNPQSAPDKKFAIYSVSRLTNDATYTIQGYNISKYGLAKVVVFPESAGGDVNVNRYNVLPCVVTNISKAIDEDGEECTMIEMYRQGTKIKRAIYNDTLVRWRTATSKGLDNIGSDDTDYTNEFEHIPLNIGDVIHFEEGSDNTIKSMIKSWPALDNTIVGNRTQPAPKTYYTSSTRQWTTEETFGQVAAANGAAMAVKTVRYGKSYPAQASNLVTYFYNLAGAYVTIVDYSKAGNNKVVLGTVKDIIGADKLGNEADLVFIKARNSQIQSIVIYRNVN